MYIYIYIYIYIYVYSLFGIIYVITSDLAVLTSDCFDANL